MIKKIIRKIVYREKENSVSYVKYLRKKGVRIGERTMFFAPMKTCIDLTRPWLIEIGDDVQITEGVAILTHGYEWSVLKHAYGEVLGSSGKVKIGNNVFIGMHTTILKGVSVGNNVIIGANSLLTKDVPDNCVVAGNPARVLMSLDEYYERRKTAQLQEAQELAREFYEVNGKEPDTQELREFFWLFEDKEENLPEIWRHVMTLTGNEEETYKMFKTHQKAFESKEDFLKSIKSKG